MSDFISVLIFLTVFTLFIAPSLKRKREAEGERSKQKEIQEVQTETNYTKKVNLESNIIEYPIFGQRETTAESDYVKNIRLAPYKKANPFFGLREIIFVTAIGFIVFVATGAADSFLIKIQSDFNSDYFIREGSSKQTFGLDNISNQQAGDEIRIVIVPTKGTVDLETMDPESIKIKEFKSLGVTSIEKNTNDELYLGDKKVILYKSELELDTANGIREKLKTRNIINGNLVKYLYENQQYIPESWKPNIILFWGTIYEGIGGQSGQLFVKILFLGDHGWSWGYERIDDDKYFSTNYYAAAVLEN